MNKELKISKHIKSKIKQLYKAYDSHLDNVTKLDELLSLENNKIQDCYHEIKKYSHYLTLLKERQVLPVQ